MDINYPSMENKVLPTQLIVPSQIIIVFMPNWPSSDLWNPRPVMGHSQGKLLVFGVPIGIRRIERP
jgi:hypothetical protein